MLDGDHCAMDRDTEVKSFYQSRHHFLQRKAEAAAGCMFNCCLLNLYNGGSHHLGWHSDNEKEFGENPTIASVTFGATREFYLRRNVDHAYKLAYFLGNGDMLIMKGSTQKHYMHAVPKRANVEGIRINLTFRQILLSS